MLIIDGHNLIGAMPDLSLSDHHCKERLLRMLEKYQYIINERMIIVFDGADFLNAEKYQRNKIEICYPPKDLDADIVIKKLIEKYKNNTGIKVVTSDNELKSLVKRRGLIIRSSKQFGYEVQSIISRSQQDTEKFLGPMDINEWLKYFNNTQC